MLNLGPIIFGFLIGFIFGTRIKTKPESNINFPLSSFVVIFLVALFVAWQVGPYPYYADLPLASGFVAGIIGIIAGKLLLGR